MLVIVTAGCGDDGGSGPPPPIDGVEAGARLRPQAWDAGGGATMLRGWLDTQLDDVACAFVPAVDGRYRCLPVTGSTDTTFADAACTVPALVVDACAPTPTWALGPRRDLAGCDGETGSPVLAIDGDHPLDVIYEGAPGACSPRIVEADVRAFATTTEAAPTAFVGADLVIGDADAAGLAPYTLVADDGSRAAVGVWDVARGRECADTRGELTCEPIEVARANALPLWADAACTVPAAGFAPRRLCAEPAVVIATDGTHAVGAAVPLADLHEGGGGCQPVAPGSLAWSRYYQLGALLDQPAPALGERLLGDGRVRAHQVTGPDGDALGAPDGFVDDELGEPCAPRQFTDGFRCVIGRPGTAGVFFADGACTDPLFIWDSPTPPVYAISVEPATDACHPEVAIAAHAPGTRFAPTGSVYVRSFDGTCQASTTPLPPEQVFFRVGAAVTLPVVEAR